MLPDNARERPKSSAVVELWGPRWASVAPVVALKTNTPAGEPWESTRPPTATVFPDTATEEPNPYSPGGPGGPGGMGFSIVVTNSPVVESKTYTRPASVKPSTSAKGTPTTARSPSDATA